MTWKLNGKQVFPAGDQPPAMSLSVADLTDPGKVRGFKLTTIKMAVTKELRRIIGGRFMREGPRFTRPTLTKEQGGIQLVKASVLPVSIDSDEAELLAVGGNAGWMEWAKATKLSAFDFGLSDPVTAAMQRACWSDEESLLNFPLANLGGLDGRTSSYNVTETMLRPGFRHHRVLSEVFASIGYDITARGRLANEWKRYGILNVVDTVRSYDSSGGIYSATPEPKAYDGSAVQSIYIRKEYLAPTFIHFDGAQANFSSFSIYLGPAFQYYRPTFDCKVRVVLTDIEITGWDPALEGTRIGFVLWNKTNAVPLGVIWSTPLVSAPGTPGTPTTPVVVSGTYVDANVSGGTSLSVGLWNDGGVMNKRLDIGTNGTTSQVEFTALSVPYAADLPLHINTIMPSWSVMDLLADLVKSRFLVVSTDDTTKTISLWFAEDYFGTPAPVLPWRDWTNRADISNSPAKVIDKQPAVIEYRTTMDEGDAALASLAELTEGPGFGNIDFAVGGYDKPTKVEVKWSPTSMAYVFGSSTMRVPLMRDKDAAYQANKYTRKPRFLIFDGIRTDGNWTHAGTSMTDWPVVYFATEGRRTLPCGFGNSRVFGDEPSDGTVEAYGTKWHRLMRSRILEIDLLLYPHELVGFNFGLPTLVDDGSGPGWYYVQEIKNFRFTGGGSVTPCVLVEIPGANVDEASVEPPYVPAVYDPVLELPPFIPADPCAGRWPAATTGYPPIEADTMLTSNFEAAVVADPTTYPVGIRILVFDHAGSIGTPTTWWETMTGSVFTRVPDGTGSVGDNLEWNATPVSSPGLLVRVLDQVGTPLEYMESVNVVDPATPSGLYPSNTVAVAAFRPINSLSGPSPVTANIVRPTSATFGYECESALLDIDECKYMVVQYTTALYISGGTVWTDSPLMSPVPNNASGSGDGWYPGGVVGGTGKTFTADVPATATYIRAKYVRGGIVQGYSTYTAL